MRPLSALLLWMGGALAQWLWSTHLTVFGVAPQLLLVMTAAAASRGGSVTGQLYGFTWGLFADALGAHVFGANAFLYSAVAYLVGALRRQVDVSSFFPQLVLTASLTPIYFLCYGWIGSIFEHRFLWVGWKLFLAAPFYNCLVAPFAFALVYSRVRPADGGAR